MKKLHLSHFFFFQQIVGPSSALQRLKKVVSLLKFFKWNVGIFTGSIEDYVPFWNIVVTCILSFVNASRVICALDPLPKFSLHFFFQSNPDIERSFYRKLLASMTDIERNFCRKFLISIMIREC